MRGFCLVLSLTMLSASCAPGRAESWRELPRLTPSGRTIMARGRPFAWRFVTAFRLVDYIADRQEAKAIAFLDWAAATGFNGVRVLSTLCCWFELTPDAGRAALPRLLTLAADRGLYVEVVALAGTREQSLSEADMRRHVAAVGRIAAANSNALVELANENAHPTQQTALKNAQFLRELRALIPSRVPVSLGSNCCGEGTAPGDYPPALLGGDYLTVHTNRSDDPSTRLAALGSLQALSAATNRYVVADEPIGAAERHQRERRSADPSAFFNEAAAARRLGIGMTFHCEDCLQGAVPGPVQRQCAQAFIRGWNIR